jgi:isopenicillin N synthase-like dioxygenase
MDQQNPTFSVRTDHPIPTLPTIDFKLLVSVDTTDLELEKLHYSCKEWGFFQVLFPAISYVSFNVYR